MEELLPALGFIIYLILQVMGVFGKKKKKGDQPDFEQPEGEPRPTIFQELERQLKELESKPKPEPVPVEVINPKAKTRPRVYVNKKQNHDKYLSPKQEYVPLSDQVELRQYQPISAEILNAPYSNLEKGILDDVHKSKFPHHQQKGGSFEGALLVKEKRTNIFDHVSPRKAFIYSLVFDRKYFKM